MALIPDKKDFFKWTQSYYFARIGIAELLVLLQKVKLGHASFPACPTNTLIYLSNYGIAQMPLRLAVTTLPDSSLICSGVVQVIPSVDVAT